MVDTTKNKKTAKIVGVEILVPKKKDAKKDIINVDLSKSAKNNTKKDIVKVDLTLSTKKDSKITKNEEIKTKDLKASNTKKTSSSDKKISKPEKSEMNIVIDNKKILVKEKSFTNKIDSKNSENKLNKKSEKKEIDLINDKKESKKIKEILNSKNNKHFSKKESKEALLENISSDSIKSTTRKSNTKSGISNYFKFLKNTFSDVSLLFKYFFHWNISKILILFWSIILGFISVIPIILIFIAYSFFSDVDISMLIGGLFNGTLLNDFLGNALLVLIVAVYFIIYSYSNLLLINVYKSYLDGSSLSYKNNNYFDFKKVVKYFNLTIINFLILLVPVLLFAVLVGILFLFSGSLNDVYALVTSSKFNYFTILSFIFFIISIVFLIYLFYRIVFSYFILTDNSYIDTKANAFSYIKESFRKTKKVKNFFKFLSIIIIFLVITFPIKFVGIALKSNVKMLSDYSVYNNITPEQKEYVNSSDPYYFQSLELEFKGITEEQLEKKLNINQIYVILFSIISFLFLNGLFVMVYSSFYKREL